jgi:hypothetical protein
VIAFPNQLEPKALQRLQDPFLGRIHRKLRHQPARTVSARNTSSTGSS